MRRLSRGTLSSSRRNLLNKMPRREWGAGWRLPVSPGHSGLLSPSYLKFYRRSRPSASGLDPEGDGRRKINQTTSHTICTVRNPQRRIKDLNPTLAEATWKCDSSQNPRLRRGATGVVGRSGAADPHGRTERSGVNFSRPISGRSRGIKFACDGTARFGTCGQNGEAAGLVPAVLHKEIGHGRRCSRRTSGSVATASLEARPGEGLVCGFGSGATCTDGRTTGRPTRAGTGRLDACRTPHRGAVDHLHRRATLPSRCSACNGIGRDRVFLQYHMLPYYHLR